MALTDLQARKAQPREKAYKLADTGGLFLFITPGGARLWRMKYRYADKEKTLSFGPYPDVSLSAARDQRDAAKRLLRDHKDPSLEKRKRKIAAYAAAGVTFQIVAKRWHSDQTARWSPLQSTKVRQAFERDVYPAIGALPLTDIDAPMVLRMLRKVEGRGAIDTAKRIRQHVSAVFSYAIAEGLCAVDPAASIGKALKPISKKGKQPAVRTIEEARGVLRTMEDSTSGPLTKLASRLLALTVVRPGVVRAAKWTEFEGIDWNDPDAVPAHAFWRIPPERMKLDMDSKDDEAFEHLVPLPPQAVEVLQAVRRLTSRSAYLFTSIRSSRHPMSENTIGYMYARNGYSGRHVPHGWRATFSTIMNERAIQDRRPDDRAIIDAMLAHKPTGMSGSEMAYNRALHMARRRELAEQWADMLIAGLRSANDLLDGQQR